jgi:flavin-binding protein dodecin
VLAEALGSSGRAAAVQRLAVGGSSHLERLHYLKEYLARAKRKPQLVLFEIAGGYDSGPLYQVHQMRFSDRMVAMMDGSSAWWALRWLVSAGDLSLSERFMLGSEILGQLALHVSHIGGSSEKSIEDAIHNAVTRASSTLRQVGWFEVVETRGHVEDGRLAH